jgi:phage/plasmid primase-like uncharacterized protein
MSADLIGTLESFGMVVDAPPLFGGQTNRYRMAGKKSKDGFCIAYERDGGKVYAVYGTWTDRDLDQKWTNNGAGTEHCNQEWRDLMTTRALIAESEQQQAAIKARAMWDRAQECSAHPYLEAKGVHAHGCRVLGNTLLIPSYDADGQIKTLQTISHNFEKKFLYKGTYKGCCFPIAGSDSRIFIAEGFATGATINELTGCKVLVAFNAGNLLEVARAARVMYSQKRIVIAADNDHKLEKNVGIEKAQEAAALINAEVVIPECPPGTDFNDLAAVDPERAKSLLMGGKAPRSVSIARIMATDYKPIKWAVEGIVPEGLTVLAGRPKFGKSWLMLGLSYAISNGIEAWGYGKTKKASVYYLALEDSERRIKDRVQSMEGYFDTYPDNLHIFTDFPKLGQGFVDELDRLISADGNVGAVIIDTLQKIRPNSGGGKRNLYQAEYEDFETLQKLAISRGVPIIAVHHTRKRSTKGEPVNPMDEISGSSGIQGVADTLIVCVRDGNKGMMHVIGREVDEEDYPMEFSRYNMTWKLSAPECKQIDVGPMVLSEWFKTHDTITSKESAEVFGINQRTAKRKLNAMVEEKKLMIMEAKNPKEPAIYKPTEIF